MEHVPQPSVWPATVGAAIALLAFGIVTVLPLSILGLLLLALGLFGWIGELRHD